MRYERALLVIRTPRGEPNCGSLILRMPPSRGPHYAWGVSLTSTSPHVIRNKNALWESRREIRRYEEDCVV